MAASPRHAPSGRGKAMVNEAVDAAQHCHGLEPQIRLIETVDQFPFGRLAGSSPRQNSTTGPSSAPCIVRETKTLRGDYPDASASSVHGACLPRTRGWPRLPKAGGSPTALQPPHSPLPSPEGAGLTSIVAP